MDTAAKSSDESGMERCDAFPVSNNASPSLSEFPSTSASIARSSPSSDPPTVPSHAEPCDHTSLASDTAVPSPRTPIVHSVQVMMSPLSDASSSAAKLAPGAVGDGQVTGCGDAKPLNSTAAPAAAAATTAVTSCDNCSSTQHPTDTETDTDFVVALDLAGESASQTDISVAHNKLNSSASATFGASSTLSSLSDGGHRGWESTGGFRAHPPGSCAPHVVSAAPSSPPSADTTSTAACIAAYSGSDKLETAEQRPLCGRPVNQRAVSHQTTAERADTVVSDQAVAGDVNRVARDENTEQSKYCSRPDVKADLASARSIDGQSPEDAATVRSATCSSVLHCGNDGGGGDDGRREQMGASTSSLGASGASLSAASSSLCAGLVRRSQPDLSAVPTRSSLKRPRAQPPTSSGDQPSVSTDPASDNPSASDVGCSVAKRARRGIRFSDVTVIFFPRAQGFTCVPSQGGSTLGMSSQHDHVQRFSVGEHAVEQRRAHRRLLAQLRAKQLRVLQSGSTSSEDSEEAVSEDVSDLSDCDLDIDNFYFLRPVSTRQRRAMLRTAGVGRIESTEREECRLIRTSREFCGCMCKTVCLPETCLCAASRIKCQVDRQNFPCGCTPEGCRNPCGRVEFNPARVRSHYIDTLLRQPQQQQQQHQQHSGLTSSLTAASPQRLTSSALDHALLGGDSSENSDVSSDASLNGDGGTATAVYSGAVAAVHATHSHYSQFSFDGGVQGYLLSSQQQSHLPTAAAVYASGGHALIASPHEFRCQPASVYPAGYGAAPPPPPPPPPQQQESVLDAAGYLRYPAAAAVVYAAEYDGALSKPAPASVSSPVIDSNGYLLLTASSETSSVCSASTSSTCCTTSSSAVSSSSSSSWSAVCSDQPPTATPELRHHQEPQHEHERQQHQTSSSSEETSTSSVSALHEDSGGDSSQSTELDEATSIGELIKKSMVESVSA